MSVLNDTARFRLPSGAIVLLTFALLSTPALAQENHDARAVLMKMSVTARMTEYQGRKIVIHFSGQVPTITRYNISHLLPDLERIDYPDAGKSIIRKDGFVWQYYPEKSLVIKKSSSSYGEFNLLQKDNLDLVLKNYYVRLSEGKPVLGRTSLLVRFDPLETGSRPSRKIWIDLEKGIPLRGEVYGADGTLYLVSHFELIDYHPAFVNGTFEIKSLNASILESMPEVAECRPMGSNPLIVAQSLWKPAVLPSGFVLKCLRTKDLQGTKRYQQFYSDGLTALSLFQGAVKKHTGLRGSKVCEVSIGNHQGRLYDLGLSKLITWGKGGQNFVLVGELPLPELIKVARSITY